jgi:ACR3 family arsenite efflux pump ArsB
MSLAERSQPLIILGAACFGLVVGQAAGIAALAEALILPLLMLMLTGAFLHVPLRRLGEVRRHGSVAALSLAINFIWTPLLAWLLGWLFLRHQPALWLGLIMLLATPCTDWYLVFTSIARGNLPLSMALLPVNLALQLLLLPVYLLLLAGAVVPLAWESIALSAGQVLLLPLGAAVALRSAAQRWRGETWLALRALPAIQPIQTTCLALAVAAMFAAQGSLIIQNPTIFLWLLAPLLAFYAINLGLALGLGRCLGMAYPNVASLCCTTMARNSPLALAVALAAFPAQPLIALTLVIVPLIELPVLAMASQILLRVRAGWRCGGKAIVPGTSHDN